MKGMATLSWMRLRGILRKEGLQIMRDPSSILLALVLPLMVLFLEGYGVSLDAENVPLALVLQDGGAESRELAARFRGSRYFNVTQVRSGQAARKLLRRGAVDGILTMRNDFKNNLVRGTEAPVQLILNGVDSNRARLVQGYAAGVLSVWAQARRHRGEMGRLPPVSIEHRIWFNEAARSTNSIIPGLIAMIMTLTGTLLTALVIAREWERGTMETLLTTPLRMNEFLVAKTLPYFVLGMGGMGLTVAVGMVVFGVPLRGSIGALCLLGSLFMLASLGLGLLFSAAIRIQFVAAQAGILAGFLPAVFLSGMIFDLESTPTAVRLISYLVPARYFVSASRTIFLAGDVWSVLVKDAAALLLMSTAFLGLARFHLQRRVEV